MWSVQNLVACSDVVESKSESIESESSPSPEIFESESETESLHIESKFESESIHIKIYY